MGAMINNLGGTTKLRRIFGLQRVTFCKSCSALNFSGVAGPALRFAVNVSPAAAATAVSPAAADVSPAAADVSPAAPLARTSSRMYVLICARRAECSFS